MLIRIDGQTAITRQFPNREAALRWAEAVRGVCASFASGRSSLGRSGWDQATTPSEAARVGVGEEQNARLEPVRVGRRARAGLPKRRAAGEKLLEAKSQLKHGEFVPWVKRNFGIGTTSASTYMRLAIAAQSETFRIQDISSLQQFREPKRRSRVTAPPWHDPVKEIISQVDTETLNIQRHGLKQQEEREAQRKLALQLIDIGYKVLAREVHPDKGGSREAMTRLNAVRDRLKKSA